MCGAAAAHPAVEGQETTTHAAVPTDAPKDTAVPPAFWDSAVAADADGLARPEERALLEGDRARWVATLWRLLADTERTLARTVRSGGEDRAQVLADFREEQRRYADALTRVAGYRVVPVEFGEPAPHSEDDIPEAEPEVAAVPVEDPELLQLSWTPGRVVAWAGPDVDLRELLERGRAPGNGWEDVDPINLPGRQRVAAVAAPLGSVLGWLVAVGADPAGHDVGSTVRWLGRAAALAVTSVARGRFAPRVRPTARQDTAATPGRGRGTARHTVHWAPVLLDGATLDELAALLPPEVGAVARLKGGSRVLAETVVGDIVDVICRTAAARIEVPAAPPRVRTTADVAETFLAHLDGRPFEAPAGPAGELAGRLDRWTKPVLSGGKVRLQLQLSPPDSSGGWLLRVLATGVERQPVLVDRAMVSPSESTRREATNHFTRLERLLPALRRPGSHRRGEVILATGEAWELMTETGPMLTAAGFDVAVPALSRRKAVATLRLEAEPGSAPVVGIDQLTTVRWTVAFGDLELDAAEISRLAREARPLIRTGGRWVAVETADLVEAAAALAERASLTRLSGSEMLRHALGLEGSPLPGGVVLSGRSWANELLEAAAGVAEAADPEPPGFSGRLRSYQAEALAWMGMLDRAGLGGCLALDMGLGKTPTVLAHLAQRRGRGPSLVIAPPAVVGNWAAEARRFAPGVRVVVHHGANRTSTTALRSAVVAADLVLTTYATAVRDVDALAEVTWDAVVLDEAQVVKNATTETARQLRRLQAHTRIALTGTPVENGLGDLWAILDFTNPGLVGGRAQFVGALSREDQGNRAGEAALRALNGILVFRRTKSEPDIAAELPDRVDQLDHCAMTPEQIGLYQAVLDSLIRTVDEDGVAGPEPRQGAVLAAITALKQICNHPAAYRGAEDGELTGRSGKLARLEEIVDAVYEADEKVLVFTHFAEWGQRLADHLTTRTGTPVACYHGGLSRTARDRMIEEFQARDGAGALVLSLKAGGTGLNLTAASHVVLYDRWWNPAVEDQARDRAWRIGQTRTVVCHRLVCPGTVDERVEEVVEGKRRIADLVLPRSSSLGDLDAGQLRRALGLGDAVVLADDPLEGSAGAADQAGVAMVGAPR